VGVVAACVISGATGTGSLASVGSAVGVVTGISGGCWMTSAAGVVTAAGVSGAVTVAVVDASTCSCVLDGDDVGACVGSLSVAWPWSFVDVLAPPELLTCISGAESAAWAG
jgi:hypothetical protein